MGPQTQYDREEEAIIEDMGSGAISQEEGRRALRDLQRDYRESAEESAREAYDRELNSWY